MKHLEKISISNARRFGKDIEIQFGKGATIILAPNGTGKTTVFEAIEFALTGAIQRLNDPPLSLIRDNQSGLDIRLNFSNQAFCEVNYRKGVTPKLIGNQNLLYNGHNSIEIPYLLRLTHLLEQRGHGWFVQCENDRAGTLLDKLSIGKTLNQINNTKTGVIRAANTTVLSDNKLIEEANSNLSTFKGLLEKRKFVSVDFTLVPLKDLLIELFSLSKNIFNEEEVVEEKLSPIIAFSGKVRFVINNKIEGNSQYFIQLSRIENLIETFSSNQNDLTTKEEKLKQVKASQELHQRNLEEINGLIENKTKELNARKLALTSLNNLNNVFNKIDLDIFHQNDLENKYKEHIERLSTYNIEFVEIKVQIENQKSNGDKFKLLRFKEEGLNSKKAELISLENLIGEWQKDHERLLRIESSTIPELESRRTGEEKELKEVGIELETAKSLLERTKESLNALADISNAIQTAVGIIASNVPKESGKCPVCLKIYEPSDLHERMSNAVKTIDPLVLDAISINAAASDNLNKLNLSFIEQKSVFEETENALMAIIEEKGRLNEIITNSYRPKFPNVDNTIDAKNWVNNEMAEVVKSLYEVQQDRVDLGIEPSKEEIDSLTLKKENKEKEIATINTEINGLSLSLRNLNDEVTSAMEKVKDVRRDVLKKDIFDREQVLEVVKEELEKHKQEQEQFEILLENSRADELSAGRILNQIVSQQNEIKAGWSELNLKENPSAALFAERKNAVLKEKEFLANSLSLSDRIQQELARWESAHLFEQYNSEIKNISGDLNEDQYLEKLIKFKEDAERKASLANNIKEALGSLYGRIKIEIEQVHKYLETINPLWTSLLKRVVVNPRFAETTLNSYTFRNKPLADVKVKLHGTDVKVMEIASEAQITDLQLTFMLSMAKTYNWSPWKALLLDDPTQHHDLVHAAAVFDLVRDFIADDDFQVLLGTHDSVHANFFQRKLENDGIPVRVYNLRADENGVRAESYS